MTERLRRDTERRVEAPVYPKEPFSTATALAAVHQSIRHHGPFRVIVPWSSRDFAAAAGVQS